MFGTSLCSPSLLISSKHLFAHCHRLQEKHCEAGFLDPDTKGRAGSLPKNVFSRNKTGKNRKSATKQRPENTCYHMSTQVTQKTQQTEKVKGCHLDLKWNYLCISAISKLWKLDQRHTENKISTKRNIR